MHDDRVPYPSRCTQLAAFGRSSPSGIRWSVRMRRNCWTNSSPSVRRSERRSDQIDLGRGLAEGAVLQHVDPGRQGDRRAVVGACEIDEEQLVAVTDEEPRTVVVDWVERRQERGDGLGCGGVAGKLQRELAPRSLGRILGLPQRLVGQPGTDTMLVDRQPRAPGELVPPAHNAGRALVQHGHGGRRSLEHLVAVGADDEWFSGHDPRRHDEEAHARHPTERRPGDGSVRLGGAPPIGG